MVCLVLGCLLLAGCGKSETVKESSTAAPETTAHMVIEVETTAAAETTAAETTEAAVVINPLPDTTMDNLTDAILSVSLEKGDAYVDDEGKLQMDVKIYSYCRYDMIDISMMKVGDKIATHAGEVEITSLERNEAGTIFINGGLEEGGMDLVTDDSGVFFETGFNDVKSWYEVGEATLRVSVDFMGHDTSDLDQGEVTFYPGDFLNDEIKNYDFTPYNTTIRMEAGQVVELHRSYTP